MALGAYQPLPEYLPNAERVIFLVDDPRSEASQEP